jgi:hypothetical protein
MSTHDEVESAPPPLSREELIAMIARAHQDSAYGESARAGQTLAAQSKLPKIIAKNLGDGIGQWSFFPEAADIVDFAFAYTPPSTEEEVWAMARTWAADDAQSRHTLMALVGREILQHELRRIEVPKLRELFDEFRPSRVRDLRLSLGLEVALPAAKAASKRAKPDATGLEAASAAGGVPDAAPAKRAQVVKREIPTRMPKPEFKRPVKAPPPAAAKRFQHAKFGEGILESQDGMGPEAKLTIKFDGGTKTLLARYVTEVL